VDTYTFLMHPHPTGSQNSADARSPSMSQPRCGRSPRRDCAVSL